MNFLKITHPDQTCEFIPGYTASVSLSAPQSVGNLVVNRGKITSVSYEKVVNGNITYVTDTPAPWNSTNDKYEFGELTHDGFFNIAFSN
jgi:predicted ATP-grasp superfamily ATP-dependent carboligase